MPARCCLPDTPGARRAAGIDLRARLADNDATACSPRLGDLVVTGPTRTNVNDFRAILIDPAESLAKEE
jgi:glycerate 2-kinase